MQENKCCFCGVDLKPKEKNNAAPITNGFCCDNCNFNIIIPYRIKQIKKAAN